MSRQSPFLKAQQEAVFQLALRQTEGLIGSIISLLGLT
jgi:hypothetical protein